MSTLHGGSTNHNSPPHSLGEATQQSHGRHVHETTNARSSAELWKTFTGYSRAVRGQNVTVFEDPAAKAAAKQKRQAEIWVQSTEINSAVFDVKQLPIVPATFYRALADQYPAAIGAVPVRQGTTNGVVIAFDSADDRTKACTVGVQVGAFTVIGTPTLSPESSVYRVSLEKLPLLRQDDLTPLLRTALSQYGRVLHVVLYRDPQTNLFFGKGYALIDTAADEQTFFKPLTHEIALDRYRLVYATWRGMEKHCFYCHKPGHNRSTCPRLTKQRTKTCYNCDSAC
ncbi:hypothetical protein G6F37_013503 [Rhizopus arrhizus]|nr:hypothetical protein G6F38_013112 [Rhizopus arrhizus]KAG1137564.1 hypothetical protein G6F37_013503 [Rhizopus arrhizus]